MKVLILVPSQKRVGGVANYFQVLRKSLDKEIEYFYFGDRFRRLSIMYPLACIIDYVLFVLRLQHKKYDIIHLNPSFRPLALFRDSIFLTIARLYNKRIVVFFRGWDENFSLFVFRYLHLFLRATYCRADAIIVLAEKFRNYLIQSGYKDVIFLETTAVDRAVFCRHHPLRSRSNLNDISGIFSILFLSRIVEEKGVYCAIDAYSIAKGMYPYINLTIAGEGNILSDVRYYVSKARIPDVSILGFVEGERKHSLLRSHDCFILPTLSEGMPNVICEAMANGLPILTRPVGGIRDFFENGKMGFTTSSLSPIVFASFIERLLRDAALCKRISKYNFRYAARFFASNVVAARLMKIYTCTLNK